MCSTLEKESFRDESANIFNYRPEKKFKGYAGPTLAVSLLERSLSFVTQDDLFNAAPVQNNFLSKWKKGRASFLRDYTSSPIEIGLKTNLLFHVSSSFSPLLSSFFVELSFFLFFFLSAAPTVRMTEGGGVTFASYEISIGEDPSDYISPLQKRRSFFFFCPSLFGVRIRRFRRSLNRRDNDSIRWNPIR